MSFCNNKFAGSMQDQMFTYYVGNTLVIISIISEWGIMVIRLDIKILVIGKGGTKRGMAKKVGGGKIRVEN
jgi:hypothetical protein